MPRPPLTIADILAWADAHKARHGEWPKMKDGANEALPLGTNWRQVDNALRLGLRGLPGGSSIAQLLAEYRGYRNIHGLPPLTEAMIAEWAVAHHQKHGCWPTENTGAVEDTAGETWA